MKVTELDRELTPDRLSAGLFLEPYFFLLETTLPVALNRWTIAGWNPSRVVTAEDPDLLKILSEGLKRPAEGDLPFNGGWIGYLGYEFYSSLEKKVPYRRSDLIPEAVFGWYENFYLYDHWSKRAYLGTSGQAASRTVSRTSPLLTPSGLPQGSLGPEGGRSDSAAIFAETGREAAAPTSNFAKPAYLSAILKIKEYITAGDCYQVNLSQRFSAETDDSPYEIYQRLRRVSPAPYSAFLNLGNAQILSASPELFLSVDGQEVTTRPIKGTRPRGKIPVQDAGLLEELITSQKDRAELLMITDLLRNDLGRVCEPGSVQVPRLCEVESFAQVHHLVSTIRGRLQGGRDVVDLLRATFPGGSITGAPKIRAMEIIHELETVPRNVYTGAIGWIDSTGNARFNIAIRTMVYKPYPLLPSPLAGEGGPAARQVSEGGTVYYWGGGGIVADSDPKAEFEETVTKVAGIKDALYKPSNL